MTPITSPILDVPFNGGFLQGTDANENFIVNTLSGDINGGKGDDTVSITVDPNAPQGSFGFNGGDGTDTVRFDFTNVSLDSLLVLLTFSGPFAILEMLGISYFLQQFDKWQFDFGDSDDQTDLESDFTNIRTPREFDVSAGRGNDIVTGITGGSVVEGNQGNDTLKGFTGSTLKGGLGADDFTTALSSPNSPFKTVVDGGRGKDSATVENIFNKNEILVERTGKTTEVSVSRDSPVGPVVNNGTFTRVEKLTLDLSLASLGADDPVTVTLSGQKDITLVLADADADRGVTDVFGNGRANKIVLEGHAFGNIFSGDRNDTLEGNQGSNKLLAGRGDDIIEGGGGGVDTLRGGRGEDTVLADGADAGSILDGGPGDDDIIGRGSAGVKLKGGNGDDFISADSADPFKGPTVIEGGKGKDLFSLSVAEGQNSGGQIVVTDFSSEDSIAFSDGTGTPIEAQDLDITQEGDAVVVGLENAIDGTFIEVRFEDAKVQDVLDAAALF